LFLHLTLFINRYNVYEYSNEAIGCFWWCLFVFLWVGEFITAIGQITLSMSFAKWYFAADEDLEKDGVQKDVGNRYVSPRGANDEEQGAKRRVMNSALRCSLNNFWWPLRGVRKSSLSDEYHCEEPMRSEAPNINCLPPPLLVRHSHNNTLFLCSTFLSIVVSALYHHSGTAALGSLLVAIVRLMRAVLSYIQAKAQQNPVTRQSKIVKAVICCCACCLWCFEKFLQYINKNAFVQTR